MAYFESEWINELLARVDIVDVISDYVSLNNKSGRLWACCPFHGEKTPSFSVSKEKQVFYCFGCHESGNVIGFVMKIENLNFPEAATFLAERVNLPLPETKNNANYEVNKKKTELMHSINIKAAKKFHENLYSDNGKTALQYLKKRGIDDKVIKRFGLGYSVDDWTNLLDDLKKQGYSIQDINQAGLCKVKESKSYDVFRNRVMFPIFDIKGNVIGFGGRVLDDSQPKYLNTSDTFVFNKRKNVYALNFAKKMKGLSSVVLTEGYMDVISLYSHGIYNAVATLGTAITKEQAMLIKRFVPFVYIAYDGDTAGKKATLKAVDIFDSIGVETKVIVFDNDIDPDEYIKINGHNAFVNAAKNGVTGIKFKLDCLVVDFDLDDYSSKAKYVVNAATIIKKIENPIEREQYILDISKQTGYSIQTIKDQIDVEKKQNRDSGIKVYQESNEASGEDIDLLEQKITQFFLTYPKSISCYDVGGLITSFSNESMKNVLILINNDAKKGILSTHAEMLTQLDEKDMKYIGKIIMDTHEYDMRTLDIEHLIYEYEIQKHEMLDILYKQLETAQDKEAILSKIIELNKHLYDKKKKPNDGR